MSSSHNIYYTQGILQRPPDPLVQELNQEIRRFHQKLNASGINFAMAFLPSKMYSKLYGWDQALAFQYFAAIAKDIGIPVYQTLDLMKTDCGTPCYYDYVHLNERGHAFVGELLKDVVRTELK